MMLGPLDTGFAVLQVNCHTAVLWHGFRRRDPEANTRNVLSRLCGCFANGWRELSWQW